MSTTVSEVDVSIRLSRDVFDEVCEVARNEDVSVDDELARLVGAGLDSQKTYRELMARVSAGYRARLAEEGKLNRSKDEVLEELRRVREQMADELDSR